MEARESLRIYGGVRLDLESLGAQGIGPISLPWIYNVLTVIDLPFSFVLDTVLLPITVPWSIFTRG